MKNIKRKIIISISIVLLCLGCQAEKPPLEFAPNGTIIEKALILKLEQKQKLLSQQLNVKKSNFSITTINVEKIEPKIMFQKPTYHLEGTYQAIISNNKTKQILNNSFSLDLQRQSRGNTWKLLLKLDDKKTSQYASYLIK